MLYSIYTVWKNPNMCQGQRNISWSKAVFTIHYVASVLSAAWFGRAVHGVHDCGCGYDYLEDTVGR